MSNRLWAVTTLFNFGRFASKYTNYLIFRAQLSVPLLTIELAPPGRFMLSEGDADIYVRISAGDVMWQQHRLYNHAVSLLPKDCDAVVFLDADVVFEDPSWSGKLLSALGRYKLVQPFGSMTRLFPGQVPLTGRLNSPLQSFSPQPSFVADSAGVTGIAWGMRRDTAEHGAFYDAAVLGGNDRLTVFAALGIQDRALEHIALSPPHEAHYRSWARQYEKRIGNSIGAIPGTVYTLWHGSGRDRRYRQRHRDLLPFDFDPGADLELSDEGAWLWRSPKVEMHRYVRDYLVGRYEDGKFRKIVLDGSETLVLQIT